MTTVERDDEVAETGLPVVGLMGVVLPQVNAGEWVAGQRDSK